MEMNRSDVSKILSMNDDKLKATIEEIAKAVGADDKKTKALTSDISSLKSKISRMDDNELNKILQSAGKENAEKIMNELNKK